MPFVTLPLSLDLYSFNTRAFAVNSRPRTKREFQECGQILQNPRCTVYKVPLTRDSLRAPLVARNKGFV